MGYIKSIFLPNCSNFRIKESVSSKPFPTPFTPILCDKIGTPNGKNDHSLLHPAISSSFSESFGNSSLSYLSLSHLRRYFPSSSPSLTPSPSSSPPPLVWWVNASNLVSLLSSFSLLGKENINSFFTTVISNRYPFLC